MSKIAALYVMKDGPYQDLDAWDESRDARKFKGPGPVIAHPPCERWGRYWGGGPMLHGTSSQKYMGDDEGCFAHALWAVRTFNGVLEHPEASHAFKFYGLPIPNQKGGWTEPDKYGGRSCCVAQGNYGHKAQKLTWLYGVGINFMELKWGRTENKTRLELGPRSKTQAKEIRSREDYEPIKRISARERLETPMEFKQMLIGLVTK